MNLKEALFGILILMFCGQCDTVAQIRQINADWKFAFGDQTTAESLASQPNWESIDLPHCFNVEDAFDDVEGYYRGPVTYKKTIVTEPINEGQRVYLKIGAANQIARVYCNDSLVDEHIGGYLAFCSDLSPYWRDGENDIKIVVDNSHNEFIAPLKSDFTFYGGIYRDVELIIKKHVSFDILKYGSEGIYVYSPQNNAKKAKVIIKAHVLNPNKRPIEMTISMRDANDSLVYEQLQLYSQTADYPYLYDRFEIDNPRLWSIEDPHQYTIQIRLDNGKAHFDTQEIKFGIRSFEFDTDKGFYLNGKYTKLIGVNRHQDRPGIGNALSTKEHIEDMEIMRSMGINFLRTAHYPQDKSILEYCDAHGIIVSMETPLDHEITDHPRFYENCVNMQVEMIHQYFNHPSILIWGYMNEMFLGKKWDTDSVLIKKTVEFAQVLDTVCRKQDPTRYTMIPNHGDFDVYHRSGIINIPMIVGWNLYYGWYEPNFEDFGAFVDHAHKVVKKPMIISEYGAGADPRLHSFKPVRFDFTQEWSMDFHNSHLTQINERPYISAAAVWNMFDFGSEARIDAVPHVNNKGLAGYDRKHKDVFYIYQSALTQKPVFYIPLSSDLTIPILSDKIEVPLRAASNLDSIYYIVNKGSKTAMKRDGYIHRSYPQFGVGDHGIQYYDAKTDAPLRKQTINIRSYKSTDSLLINFGADFYLFESYNRVWIPFKKTEHISLTGEGIHRFLPRDRGVGTNLAIANTDLDPLFQTAIRNIEQLKIPLGNGHYTIKLHFSPISKLDIGKTKFNLTIGDQSEIIDLSQPNEAYQSKTISIETNILDESLKIDFKALVGQTFINAIEIIKK
jgi:beta-galactosidase